VLTMRREHCHAVDRMLVAAGLRSGLLIGGEDYRRQFCETRDAFSRGDVQVGVGTLQAVGVGFDLPAASRGIIASPAANSRDADKQLRQFVGRFSRTAGGKRDAAVYYLWDRELSGTGPLDNLRRWFPGNVVVRHEGRWLPAGEYMKELRRSKR
jgi:superfamily II DNA or RNA helicase